MMMKFRCSNSPLVVLLWLQLLVGGAAAGQTLKDSFDSHYQRGLRSYERGDYEVAVREFQRAFAIRQMPKLLFNLGQAHRKLGHAKEALGYLQNYLRVEPSPSPETRAELESYIEATRPLIDIAEQERSKLTEAERARTAPPGQAPPPPPPRPEPGEHQATAEPEPAPGRANRSQPAVAASPAPPSAPASVEGARPPLYKRWWLWTGVGVGVAGLVALSVGLTVGRRSPCDSGVFCFKASF